MPFSFKFTHFKHFITMFISHLIEIALYHFIFNQNLQNNATSIKIHIFWRLSETDMEYLLKLHKGALLWTKKKEWLRQSITINLSCINIFILQTNLPRIKCSSALVMTAHFIQFCEVNFIHLKFFFQKATANLLKEIWLILSKLLFISLQCSINENNMKDNGIKNSVSAQTTSHYIEFQCVSVVICSAPLQCAYAIRAKSCYQGNQSTQDPSCVENADI